MINIILLNVILFSNHLLYNLIYFTIGQMVFGNKVNKIMSLFVFNLY